MPDTFLDFAIAHVDLGPEPDVYCPDENWNRCIRNCGINATLANVIMLPEFHDIRYSQSAKFWITEAIRMNFEALETINDRLKANMNPMYMMEQRRRPGYSFSREDNPQPLPFSSNFADSKKKKSKRETKQSGSNQKNSSDSSNATKAKSSLCPSGFVTLWKGVSMKRCQGLINPDTQELQVQVLCSDAPSDFSSRVRLVYFTPQKSVADRYAKFAKLRATQAEIAIVQIQVPYSFSEQKINGEPFSRLLLNSNDPDNEWRQLVWHSKGSVLEPRSFRDIRRCGLLIGHCTTGMNIQRLANHRMVGDQHILKVDENGKTVKALQWVLQGDIAEADFNDQCRGNAWVWNVGQLATAVDNENAAL